MGSFPTHKETMPTAIKLAIINFPKSFQDKPKRACCKERRGNENGWGQREITHHQVVLFLCMLVCLHHAKRKQDN